MERNETHRRSKDEESIIAYLLGTLSEVEADRFEQRYLADEVLFEAMQEIEDELIDDYASGALTGQDRARFEQHFMRSPERREKVQFSLAMTERAVAWKKESATSAQSSTAATQSSSVVSLEENEGRGKVLPFKRWSRPVPAWRQWGAIAAAILIAVGAGGLWLRNRELRRELVAISAEESQLRERAKSESERAVQAQNQLNSANERERSLLAQLRQAPTPEPPKPFDKFIPLEYVNPTTMGGGRNKMELDVPFNAPTINLELEFEHTRFRAFNATLYRAPGGSPRTLPAYLNGPSSGRTQKVKVKIPRKGFAGNYWLGINGLAPPDSPEPVGYYYLIVVRH